LLDRAFEEEGFCVVRGPDLIFGGDIRNFHVMADRFDGVIGGPPCQQFSKLQALVRHNRKRLEAEGITDKYQEAPNLIPEFERVVAEAQPAWFLMENVPQAPEPIVEGYQVKSELLCPRWIGEEQSRLRRFSFGTADGRPLSLDREWVCLQNPRRSRAICAAGSQWVPTVRVGGSGKVKPGHVKGAKNAKTFAESCRLQGLGEDFDLPHFNLWGKFQVVGNGVPIPMGRVVARAIKAAMLQ
jgi:DNA (cytosine-5)-methyltransferase 1